MSRHIRKGYTSSADGKNVTDGESKEAQMVAKSLTKPRLLTGLIVPDVGLP